MLLYAKPGNWLKKYNFRKYVLHKSKCVRHRQNVIFCTKNINLWNLWCLSVLETFGSFPRKHPWWSYFCISGSEILLRERLYHQCFLSWEIFKMDDVWHLGSVHFSDMSRSKVNMKKALMEFQIQLKKIEEGVEIY